MSERDDPPHQPPASNEYLDAFNKSFQLTFLATTFVFVIFAALGVRIARRLRRDSERNRNIIDADWSPVEDSDETDLTLR